MLEPIDIDRIHRIFDPRPDPIELLRESVNRKAELRRHIEDGLFFIALGLIAATTMGVLVWWCQP